jgi:hypothetical protein
MRQLLSIYFRMVMLAVPVLASGLCLLAQDQPDESKPQPAAKSLPGISAPDNQDDTNGTPWTADTGPLTGMQTPTLGHPELKHSYWVPGVIYGLTVDKGPSGGSSNGWYANNYFGGNVSLLEEKSRSELALNFTAGGFVSSGGGQNNGWFSQLALAETYNWQRLQLQVFDQFAYLPETQSGFGGGTGLSIPGIGGSLGPPVTGIGGSVTPQSIFATSGPRYNNSVVVQATYQLSRRGSITLGGSDGILRFTQSGNIDSDTYFANLGYNYQLTKEDTIGLQYRFMSIHYIGINQAFGDHTFSVVYGRKITKRLALQIFGGPEITTYRVPVQNQTQRITGSASASLTYGLHNGNISMSYLHGLSSGGGILVGSNTDNFNLAYGRSITRLWSGHADFGYVRNSPIAAQAGIITAPYNDWLLEAGAGRPIGRNAAIDFAYTARIETTNPNGCTGSGCYTGFTGHMITVSIQWHTRPFLLP